MQWLLEGICPNYHNISSFRKDNPKALKQLFKLFVSFLKDVDLDSPYKRKDLFLIKTTCLNSFLAFVFFETPQSKYKISVA